MSHKVELHQLQEVRILEHLAVFLVVPLFPALDLAVL